MLNFSGGNQFFGLCQSRRKSRCITTATPGAIGFSTTLTTDKRGDGGDEFSCRKDSLMSLAGDGNQRHRTLSDSRQKDHTFKSSFQCIGDRLKCISIGIRNLLDDCWDGAG